ncbi:hypothetical protein CFAEC_10270 [Corynebacterium faecale]|uniref:hypothetical protein n=1 Tax=Corynebacterium faecale TaxID=1758466 RepID=UPI0025B5DE4A|nr:hypothetical protein [Corynebacterium faecale]WJY92867.1 hypothetical protein CFAEC_10270 [Corynebacterium faecale]
MHDFETTIDRIRREQDPSSRGRVEQFIVEVVRSLPNLTTKQAASLSIQLLEALQFADSSGNTSTSSPIMQARGFNALAEMTADLEVRSDAEWHSFGFHPVETAHPLMVAIPQIEIFYLRSDVASEDPEAAVPDFQENQAMWRNRLGTATEEHLIYKEFTGPGDAERAVRMLGNLWKIGVVVTRNTKSKLGFCDVINTPEGGEKPFPLMDEQNCWYHIQISESLGENQVPEIIRCVAEIFTGYHPQFWEADSVPSGKLRIQESEAATYIALSRLGLPDRTGNTAWSNSYISTHPLSPAFRWDVVLEASHQLENLLRGDTVAVTAAPEEKPGE